MASSLKKDQVLTNIVEKYKIVHGQDITKKVVTDVISAMEKLITEDYVAAVVENKEDLHFSLLNTTMKVVFIPEHKSRNPRTGEPVDVPNRWALRLSSSPKNAE